MMGMVLPKGSMHYPIRTRGRAALFVGSIVVAGGCGATVENGGSRAGGGGAPTSSTSGSTTSGSTTNSTGAGGTSAGGTVSATATGTGPSTTGPSTTTSSAVTVGSGGSGGSGAGGMAGAGGGGSGAGGANARDAGSPGGASGVDAGSGGSSGSVQQLCVDTINMYRATLGLAPYARWTAEETCGNAQAQSDSQTGTAHGAFGMCTESAQNECPGWPAPPETMIIGCLQAMWNEGPGADFATHGHYINMSSTQYRQAACGFYTTPAGRIWSVQDFK